jgi:hypothetical protein
MTYNFEALELVEESTQDLDNIVEQIKSTPLSDVVSVINQYVVTDNIIRTNNLVFHDNSELIFKDLDVPYIIIAAKNLKFNAPQIKSTIKLANFDTSSLKGQTGAKGADGGSEQKGGDGDTGTNGNTKEIPDVFLFIENIATDHGELSTFDWQIKLNGLSGGEGGTGGNGGNGGKGSKGRNSSSGFGFCRKGAGNGSKGGDAGRGGRGGNGGDGGDGAIVYLVGSSYTTDRLIYAQYFLEGGKGGDGGKPGNSGLPGKGGDGGKGSTHCSGGDRGSSGNVPGNLGSGIPGQNGNRGEIKIIERSNSDLF